MKKTLSILDRALEWMMVVLMVSLVVSISWQVVSRYLFASPSSWTEELARFLLIWIGTLGAAYVFRLNMHIGLDLLPKKLTGDAALRLHRFTQLVVIVFAVTVLVIGGASLVQLTWELRQYSPVLGLPVSFVYVVIPLSGFLIVVYSIAGFSTVPAAEHDAELEP